jgi:S1-C subfamily serine protease
MSHYPDPPQLYPVRRPRQSVPVWPFLIVILLLVGLLIRQSWPPSVLTPEAVTPRGDLADDEKSTIELFKANSPSVVHIVAIREQTSRDLDFNIEVPQGTGSGFIWSSQGYVVTNYHVVRDGSKYIVRLADQSQWEATLTGKDENRDLAVLHIQAPLNRLKPILRGESHNLQVGQKVFAIGNPFGLDQTLTTGVVSGLGRAVNTGRTIGEREHILRDLIQADAAINPGNSGGPLLDSAGRLIGVNTAILSPSGASAGIGFAIPVDEVRQIVPMLIQHGQVFRPSLGIRPVPEQLARQILSQLGVKGGVLFSYTYPTGPARAAKLQATQRDRLGDILVGDIIVSINGKAVNSPRELHDTLNTYQVGDTVTVGFLRGNNRFEVALTLDGEAS